ncbi:MAG: outer membrane beta-barrel protein [Cucumibacter sp.]
MLKKLALAAVAALGLSTTAQAADWSGFYLGVLGGVSMVSIPECGSECDITLPGIAKVAGYNWDNGDVIFGIDEMVVVSFLPDDIYNTRKIQWQKMARVGFEITDNAMIYGAAGAGIAFVWADCCVPSPPDNSAFYAAVAAGAEVMLNENLIWRTHLQYSRSEQLEDCTGCFIQAFSAATGLVWAIN